MRICPVISVLGLALAALEPAGAQSFVFSSCASGVTFRGNISGLMLLPGNPISDGQGGRLYNYMFQGTFALTQHGSTQTSSGFSLLGVNYQVRPVAIGGPVTVLLIEAPNADGTGGPGLGAKAAQLEWGAGLQGAGDLMPNGFTGTLPPLAQWVIPGGGNSADYIFQTGARIDMFGACPASGGGSAGSGDNKALGNANLTPGCITCGAPINLGTGNMFEQVTDYQTSGQNRLSFTRYYNSLGSAATLATALGTKWRSNYDRYLRIVSASSVTAERPDGAEVIFTLNSGAWTTDTDVDVKLTNSGATWTLTDNKDTIETYTATGASQALLQSIRMRNGYTQNLLYGAGNQLSTVTDSYNRQLSFTYSAGRLQTVTTPDGLILTYGYAGALLTAAGYSTSPPTSQAYVYENSSLPSALTGVIDENGNRYSAWTYDSTGRATSSQHGAGAGLIKIAYNDTDGSRTMTGPLGEQEVFRFSTLQGIPKLTEEDRTASASQPAATRKFTYDSNGYPASRTDWNGNMTSYVNDAHGQPTTINEAVGSSAARTTTIAYHQTFHLPVRIVQPGIATTLTYDSNGQLLTRTVTDTTTTTVPYSTGGQTRTWTYTWSNALLASIKTPRTDVNSTTTFSYDSGGALTAITNALGQTVQIQQRLPGGWPQTVVDPNGVVAHLTYDPRLRLLSNTTSTAAGPLMTNYSYDGAGNLLGVTLPDGSAYTNSYDSAHRLTGFSDLLNQNIAYTLDAQGDRTQASIADASGATKQTHSRKFDALGRLLQDIGAAGQTTTYGYDANGNPTAVTDPLQHVRNGAFDALNRPFAITDPVKGVTSVKYDALNRPIGITDPNGGVTTYVYDGFGEVIQRVSPDSGATVYHYDPDGNLTQRVDGSGAVINATYDALDRVLTVTYPGNATENVTNTYDRGPFGAGRLTGVSDAVGTMSRTFDERGNLLTEIRVAGGVTLVTSYTYDAVSRVASITYPSGWTVAYTRDIMGRVTGINPQAPDGSPAVPVLANIGYQPFGPPNAMTFGNGVAESRSFDLDGRVTSLTGAGAATLQVLTYAYDAANNTSSIGDAVTSANSQSFSYDALNRLTSATGAYGNLGYTYDSVGNRLTQTGSAAAYGYAAHSNQLTSVTVNGAQQTVGYTKSGHVSSFQAAGGMTTTLTYNQAGRLASVAAGNNPAAQYTYDAFGKRLLRVGAVTATTLYQYDRRRRLLEETDGQGNPQVDYIYLDSRPVATISPSTGQVYFLHDDRLGTPQLATDSNQNVVWSASYGPFGEMSAVPSGIVQDLRLPGQEFDVETGFYHNGFRDYAPGWGRYLQSDPIGVAGGLNSYAYVRGNPARFTDRIGLDPGCEDPSDYVDFTPHTLQVGVGGNVSSNQYGYLWGWGLAVDDQGTVAVYDYQGGTANAGFPPNYNAPPIAGYGESWGGGPQVGLSNSPDGVMGLAKGFNNYSASGGPGSVEVFTGTDDNGNQVFGESVTYGPQEGVSISAGSTYTAIYPLFNFQNVLNDLVNWMLGASPATDPGCEDPVPLN
jgi:RHS repeat-associated protein